jgi:hypothetical protein
MALAAGPQPGFRWADHRMAGYRWAAEFKFGSDSKVADHRRTVTVTGHGLRTGPLSLKACNGQARAAPRQLPVARSESESNVLPGLSRKPCGGRDPAALTFVVVSDENECICIEQFINDQNTQHRHTHHSIRTCVCS